MLAFPYKFESWPSPTNSSPGLSATGVAFATAKLLEVTNRENLNERDSNGKSIGSFSASGTTAKVPKDLAEAIGAGLLNGRPAQDKLADWAENALRG